MNAVALLHKTLQQCPDQAPAPTTTELVFILEPDLRAGLRIDISTAFQAEANGEWKAATVLAGSVIEALLLWAVKQAPRGDLRKACSSAVAKGTLSSPPRGAPERWMLSEYIAVAEELTKIDAYTATQARLAQNFRNLIHPGRAQRLAKGCDRGTALGALAAVEMIVRCLS